MGTQGAGPLPLLPQALTLLGPLAVSREVWPGLSRPRVWRWLFRAADSAMGSLWVLGQLSFEGLDLGTLRSTSGAKQVGSDGLFLRLQDWTEGLA